MILRKKYDIYFSACDTDGGIYRYRADGAGNIEFAEKYSLDRPMYLIIKENKLYCVLRECFDDCSSGVVSFDIAEDGTLENQSEIQSTMGKCGCHICEHDGAVYCTNYLSGSVAKLPGKIVTHSGSGINPQRQEAAHTHFVCTAPDGENLFVCDLGTDKIFVYDKDLNKISSVDMIPGCGPRHIALHPDGETVFCVNELASSVSILTYKNGVLTPGKTVNALPDDFEGENTSAAIRYENNKIYVSNRGHDSITVMDYENKSLTVERIIPVQGKSPRDLWVDEDVFICTNQDSNSVTVLSRDGELLFEFEMPCPISVFVKAVE